MLVIAGICTGSAPVARGAVGGNQLIEDASFAPCWMMDGVEPAEFIDQGYELWLGNGAGNLLEGEGWRGNVEPSAKCVKELPGDGLS